jgi:hypothetical protein
MIRTTDALDVEVHTRVTTVGKHIRALNAHSRGRGSRKGNGKGDGHLEGKMWEGFRTGQSTERTPVCVSIFSTGQF